MTSVTLSRRVDHKNTDDEESKIRSPSSYSTDNCHRFFHWSTPNQQTKTTRALSCNEERRPSTLSTSNNNRLKHLCSRLIRRFSITKEYRTRSEDLNRGLTMRFNNYKSFSSTIDDTYNEYDWPDFEKVYDSIPPCLVKTLPGLDDISSEASEENSINITNFNTDETNDYTPEQMNIFVQCKRGKHFRRNAMCHKLDKSQYSGQLDTFIQQLMIEKLMRTWT
jgi:hypothetical protein